MSAVGADNCIHKNSSLSKMFDKKSITQLISVVNRRKERKVNDWWSYLAHAQKAEERKGHKYIARVEVGTKRGRTIYRYFYTMDQYKQYLSQKEKGVKSEAEKRQSPLYNLKRVATQIKNLLNDRDRAVNDVNLGQRAAAYKRMEYDKALLKSAGKDFLDSIKDKLKIPVKDADKAAGAENVKNICILSALRCQTANTGISIQNLLTRNISSV